MNKSGYRAARSVRAFFAWALVAFLTLWALPGQAATATLTPTADAYVQNGANAAVNYGTATSLRIQASATAASNYESHLKFDTTSVSGVISNAKLRIHAKLTATGTITTSAYGVPTTTWGETTLTWSNKPAVGASLGSVVVNSTSYAYKDIDVTAYVQSEFAANRKIMSFAYRSGANTTPYITAYSKNSTNVNKPQLVITYTANAAPTVSVSSPTAGASFTAPASVSLSANADDSDGTITKIEFYNGATLLNTDTVAPYSYNWTGVAPGTYSITAKATDNSGAVTTSGAVSVTVSAAANAPPSSTLTSPTIGATFTAPASISLSANATDSDGTISKVEFYQGATLLGTIGSPPYTYSLNNMAVGSYSFTAKATDNKSATTTSSVVSVTVQPSANLTISYAYDELGRLVGAFDATGSAVTYGYDPVGNITKIERKSAGSVAIIEFTPDSNVVGSTVNITGVGFSATPSANTVSFNGTAATVIAATVSSLQVSVPVGATSGPISVTSPNGSAISASSFIVATSGSNPPTITGFTPTIGPAGTTVTITGTGFQTTKTDNSVRINGFRLGIISATSTSIAAVIPSTIGSGKIKVTTPYGSALSLADYYYTPSPYVAADVEVATRMNNPGSKAISIATPGKVAVVLFDGADGQRVGLYLSGVTIPNSTVTIYRPDGLVYASVTVSTSGNSIGVAPLPMNGTYAILVAPAASGTGSMVLDVGGGPDLAISNASIGAVIVNQDGTFSIPVTYTVTNQGTVAVKATWHDLATLSVDGVLDNADQGLLGNNFSYVTLAVGASYTRSAIYTTSNATAVGVYTLFIKADGRGPPNTEGTYTDDGIVGELNEANNVAAMSVTLSRPDLVISNASISGVVVNLDGYYYVTVTYTVTNQGTIAAQGWNDVSILSVDGVLDNADRLFGAIGATTLVPGASSTRTITFGTSTTIAAGTYTWFIKADGRGPPFSGTYTDGGIVAELNEANNVAAIPVTLPVIIRPDLAISNASISGVVANPNGSFSIPVTFTVTNNGTGTAQPVWFDLAYLSVDGVLDNADQPLSGQAFRGTALAPGANYPVTITYTTSTATVAGAYTLILKTDGHNASYTGGTNTDRGRVVESNEANNVAALAVTLP